MYPFCYCKLTKTIFTGVLVLMTVALGTSSLKKNKIKFKCH